MKSMKASSPYSKMYLIPPNMYEKLLSCLDEKELRQAEELNVEKDISEQQRPGEKQVEMMTKEALGTDQPEMEAEITPPEIEGEIVEPQQLPETEMLDVGTLDPEDIPLAELQRQKNIMSGRISFKKPLPGKIFTCDICLKSFKRNWDLSRHMKNVHKNILQQTSPGEQSIGSSLDIAQSNPQIQEDVGMEQILPRTPKKQMITPRFVSDEDTEMIFEKPSMSQSCKVSSDTTSRVIPELYFKPPRGGKMVVPQMKKRMKLLTPHFTKKQPLAPQLKARDVRNVKLVRPIKKSQPAEGEELMSFEDWTEPKKRGARTASEAELRSKPAKWVTEDFEQWKKK